ncbi:chorismate mutase [Gordonia sp. (in: high G+C Gram-positive bacteria)]|uniref:chorismate mutase n=1 Tax=Gordonia sp. (in: high G+C Gram-positive bacteria) TaxID=84139 RepID=UPI003C7483F0
MSGNDEQQRETNPADNTTSDAELFALDLDALNLSSDVSLLPDDIDELRPEIDRMDAIILAAIERRSAVSKKIGAHRMATGGPRLVHSREMKVLDRFSALGTEGHTLAMLLLRLGRGPLGR